MSAAKVSTIEALLRASSSDETTLTFPVPDAVFGFHAQQAIEKLMLVLKTGTHPFSHNLLSLHKRLEQAGISLPALDFPVERPLSTQGPRVMTNRCHWMKRRARFFAAR